MPIEACPSRSLTTLGWTLARQGQGGVGVAHTGSAVAGRRTLRVGRLEAPHELPEGAARPVADRPAVREAGCLELEGRQSLQAAPALGHVFIDEAETRPAQVCGGVAHEQDAALTRQQQGL